MELPKDHWTFAENSKKKKKLFGMNYFCLPGETLTNKPCEPHNVDL